MTKQDGIRQNLYIAMQAYTRGDVHAAISKCIALNEAVPNNSLVLGILGSSYKALGDLTNAEAYLKASLQIDPGNADFNHNYSGLLASIGDYANALTYSERACRSRIDCDSYWLRLGHILWKNELLDDARLSIRRALRLKETSEAYQNLGCIEKDRGELDCAIAATKKALQLDPRNAKGYQVLGAIYQDDQKLEKAFEAYVKSLELDPQNSDTQLDLSMCLFLLGRYSEGWKFYEARANTKGNAGSLNTSPASKYWGDTGMEEGRVVFICEQGLGDTFQFMRYIRIFRERGIDAKICAPDKLHGLIISSEIDSDPISTVGDDRIAEGYWFPLMSTGRLLDVSPQNPVANEPYIKTDKILISKWKKEFACEQKPIIGLSWQGNPKTEKNHLIGRSVHLESLRPLAMANEDISFVSVQKGFGEEQLDSCSFRDRFVEAQPRVSEQIICFKECAAVIAACDLVITTDTAVAHLAGGLGKQTWLLLKKVPDWRWGMDGSSTFWYSSMRLFRQNTHNNWQEAIERVAAELSQIYK